MENIIEGLLLIKNPEMSRVSQYVTEHCNSFLGVFFLLGVIFEYFYDWNFKEILFRTLLASIIINTYQPFLVKGVEISISTSNDLIKNSPLITPSLKVFLIHQKLIKK